MRSLSRQRQKYGRAPAEYTFEKRSPGRLSTYLPLEKASLLATYLAVIVNAFLARHGFSVSNS
jgi:hypothetical protein